MTAFHELDAPGQVLRLTEIAKKAVEAYGVRNPQIQLVKHEMNTIFKVTGNIPGDSPVNALRDTYILRVHPGSWLDFQSIHAELTFLAMAVRQGGLMVSEPVAALDGSLVQVVSTEGVPEPRCCVMFHWLEGEFQEELLTGDSLEKSGEFLARLHEFGRCFVPPEGFKRPRLDAKGLLGKGGVFDPRGGDRLFSVEQRLVFEQAFEVAEEKLEILGDEADQFGFIHGDYYFKNFLICNGQVGAIDFDMCGWGYYIFDLVMPYWPARQENIDEAFQVFLKGYLRIRPLPEGVLEYADTFDALRRLIDMAWVASRDDHPLIRSYAPHILSSCTEQLKAYIGKSR